MRTAETRDAIFGQEPLEIFDYVHHLTHFDPLHTVSYVKSVFVPVTISNDCP